MIKKLTILGMMTLFLFSVECNPHLLADCPKGQIDIDDKGTCKAIKHVVRKADLAAEIQRATANGNWSANLNYIDTSRVRDMSYLFADKHQILVQEGYDLEKFNGRIDKWDTGRVVNMRNMFQNASFNQPIGNWDVYNVTNMSQMFYRNPTFNQEIGDWDVSNVTNFSYMFSEALSFNQDIGDWEIDNAKIMEGMFGYTAKFNYSLNKWNVSNVTNIAGMFYEATAFDQDLSAWTLNSAIDEAHAATLFEDTKMFLNKTLTTKAPWYCKLDPTGCQ